MNTKHTPGPWKVATTYARAQAGKFDVVPWATQRQRICRIAARADYPTAQALADAELIAAAPELLAALVETLEELELARADELWPTGASAVARRARAAILKARGE